MRVLKKKKKILKQTFEISMNNVVRVAVRNGICCLHKKEACTVLIQSWVWPKQIHQTGLCILHHEVDPFTVLQHLIEPVQVKKRRATKWDAWTLLFPLLEGLHHNQCKASSKKNVWEKPKNETAQHCFFKCTFQLGFCWDSNLMMFGCRMIFMM